MLNRAVRVFFPALAILVTVTPGAAAQAPAPGAYSPAQFEVQQSRGHLVTMRDGVHLSVDIYQPATSGRYASLLSIVPYDNNSAWKERAKWFAQRGYVMVNSDSRGRFGSPEIRASRYAGSRCR